MPKTVRYLWLMQVMTEPEPELAAAGPGRRGGQTMDEFVRDIERKKQRELAELQFSGGDASIARQPILRGEKIGRNDPCPCGSGRKYKRCCEAAA